MFQRFSRALTRAGIALCTAAVLTPFSLAREDDIDDLMNMSLDEILELDVSSASKSSMKVEDAPGIVSVITREDIRNFGAETLEDILNLIPGITTGRSIQSGFHQSLYVRGSFSLFAENVLILRNGQRLNDPVTGGAVTFSPDYPVSRVKQIEIIRGPGSALYGANAFVALINIITDEETREGGQIDVAGGTSSSGDVSFYYGKNLAEGVHLGFGVDYIRQELEDIPGQSFTQYSSENPPPFPIGLAFNTVFDDLVTADQTETWNISGSLNVQDFELRVDYESAGAENNWGSGVQRDPVTDMFGTYDLTDDAYRNDGETEVFRVGAFYTHEINDALTLSPSVTYADFSLDSFLNLGNLVQASNNYRGEGRRSGIFSSRSANTLTGELSLTWQPSEGQTLVAGYSFQHDEIDRTLGARNSGEEVDGIVTSVVPPYPNGDVLEAGDRTVHALYAQYTWQVSSRFALTGGVRGDDYSDFGSTVNPRLAMVYRPAETFNVKALYGQAFRAPTFLETNNFTSGAIIPNPDLDPEEIATLELQLNYKPIKTLKTALSLYSYEIDNVIRQVPTFQSQFETQARNQGRREGEGLELELRYQPDVRKMFFFNYSYVDSTDINGGVETAVEAVPETSLNFGFVYDLTKEWVVGLSGYHREGWVSQSAIPLPDIEIPGYGVVEVDFLDRLDFPDYTVLNLEISRREITRGLELSLDIDNLLDEHMYFGDQHFYTPGGIATGGRVTKLGLRYEF